MHHIVKAEVHAEVSEVRAEIRALNTKVDMQDDIMKALVKAEVSTLKAEVNERFGALEAKVDTIANSVFEIARELKARGRLEA